MKTKLFALVCLLFICAVFTASADTVTSGSLTKTEIGAPGSFRCYTIDWLSDASGNCTADITGVQGEIMRFTVNPDDGATSPTNAYDMTLKDRDGVDILAGLGANLSNSTALSRVPLTGDGTTTTQRFVTLGTLSLAITNAGAANGGILRVYVKR